jgi:hypothetical protein
MLRLLVLILLAWLVYRGIESVLGQLRGATAPRVTVHREPQEITEELVACTRCGVRVPKSRAVGGAVCSTCGATEPLG